MKLRIISWNIDCIGARFEAFKRMMDEYKPDIACLQKFKSSKAPENFMIPGYTIAVSPINHGGVATYVRDGIVVLSQFVPADGPFKGHLLKTELANPHVSLFNTYVPYANKTIEGYEEKRRVYDDLLLKEIEVTSTPILMCGDMNIVHTQYDTSDGRHRKNVPNYRDWERDNFEQRLSVGKLIDTFRSFHPEETVSTYYGFNYKQGRELNMGVRLDYFLASESLRQMITKADVLHEVTDAPSTPIILEMDTDNMNPAAQLIADFVKKRLNGDLNQLATFNLAELKGDKKYGCPSRSFDCDDTNLSRAIYCLTFCDVFPAMSLDTLKDYIFRGDTLNTYNTMFGRPDETSMHPGLDRYNPSSALSDKVKAFHKKYHTIGNIMPLPCLMIGRQSINTYRGTHPNWRDFLDRFLGALQPILIGNNEEVDKGLSELVSANIDALKPYCSEKGFTKLMKGLMLEDYLDKNGLPVINSKGFYFWRKSNVRDEYLAEAERYIDFATGVIDRRAKRIIKTLKDKLNL